MRFPCGRFNSLSISRVRKLKMTGTLNKIELKSRPCPSSKFVTSKGRKAINSPHPSPTRSFFPPQVAKHHGSQVGIFIVRSKSRIVLRTVECGNFFTISKYGLNKNKSSLAEENYCPRCLVMLRWRRRRSSGLWARKLKSFAPKIRFSVFWCGESVIR